MTFVESLQTAADVGWWVVLAWLSIEVLRFAAFTPLKTKFPGALKNILSRWPGAGGPDDPKNLLDELLQMQNDMKTQFAEVNKGVRHVQISLANVDDIVGNILKNTEVLLSTLTQWAAHFDSMSAALLDIDRDISTTKKVSEEHKIELAKVVQSAADLNNGLQRIGDEMNSKFSGLETELNAFGSEITLIKNEISSINGGIVATTVTLAEIKDDINRVSSVVDQKTRAALNEHTLIVEDLIKKIKPNLDTLLKMATTAQDEFTARVERGKDDIKKILEDDITDKNGKLNTLINKLNAIQMTISDAVNKKGEKARAAVKDVNNQRQQIKFSINDLIDIISKYDENLQGVRNHAGVSYHELTRQATMIPELRALALKLNEEMVTLQNLFDSAQKQKGDEDDKLDKLAKKLWADEKFNLQEQEKLEKLAATIPKIEEGLDKVKGANSEEEKKSAEAFLRGWRNAAQKLTKQLQRIEYRDDRRTDLNEIINGLIALNAPAITQTLRNVGQQIRSYNSNKIVELSGNLHDSLSSEKLKTVRDIKAVKAHTKSLIKQITSLNEVEGELRKMIEQRKKR
jgi:hypothetical protein